MVLKEYEMNGWSSLRYKCLVIDNLSGESQQNFNKVVTKNTTVKIYPDRQPDIEPLMDLDKNLNNELDDNSLDDNQNVQQNDYSDRYYYKEYQSADGFTVCEIFDLCVKTYWAMIKNICDNDITYIDYLSLTSFVFDTDTNCVYPNTDS